LYIPFDDETNRFARACWSVPQAAGFSALPQAGSATRLGVAAPTFAFVGVFEDLPGSAFLLHRALGWGPAKWPAKGPAPVAAAEKLDHATRGAVEASESRCAFSSSRAMPLFFKSFFLFHLGGKGGGGHMPVVFRIWPLLLSLFL
jgi:hypothetical protein